MEFVILENTKFGSLHLYTKRKCYLNAQIHILCCDVKDINE